MKKIDLILGTIEKWLLVILMLTMTVVVALQVIFRYVIHSSLPWSEELSRYCLVFATFIGVSAGLRAGTHTCVDFLISLLPRKASFWLAALAYFATLCFSVAFVIIGVQMSLQMKSFAQKTAGLHIPMWIPYSAIPLGFAGGCIRSAQNLIDHFKNRKNDQTITKGE